MYRSVYMYRYSGTKNIVSTTWVSTETRDSPEILLSHTYDCWSKKLAISILGSDGNGAKKPAQKDLVTAFVWQSLQ